MSVRHTARSLGRLKQKSKTRRAVGALGQRDVSVEIALLSFSGDAFFTVVAPNKRPGARWALPTGPLNSREALDQAARRVLREQTGIREAYLEQLRAYDRRTAAAPMGGVSVAYYALVDAETAQSARLIPGVQYAQLSFPSRSRGNAAVLSAMPGKKIPISANHAAALRLALHRLREQSNSRIPYQLLPGAFSLSQLQRLHEAIHGRLFNKDSFRRSALATDHIEPSGRAQAKVGHRPAQLYRLKKPPRS